jgi:uncharacterized membrane protein
MAGNVFFNIIPNQRKVVADLIAGKEPNPNFGKQAKIRSSHNNYMTLPVLFLMICGHYPMVYLNPYPWAVVGLVLVAGGVVRHFYNQRHRGIGNPWWAWVMAAVCMAAAAFISLLGSAEVRDQLGLASAAPDTEITAVVPQQVADIVQSRCSMCHAREPVWAGLAEPPKGVLLETPDEIERAAHQIRIEAALSTAMPPNNITEITSVERQVLSSWAAGR